MLPGVRIGPQIKCPTVHMAGNLFSKDPTHSMSRLQSHHGRTSIHVHRSLNVRPNLLRNLGEVNMSFHFILYPTLTSCEPSAKPCALLLHHHSSLTSFFCQTEENVGTVGLIVAGLVPSQSQCRFPVRCAAPALVRGAWTVSSFPCAPLNKRKRWSLFLISGWI